MGSSVRGIAVGLLCTAGCDREIALVARRVRSVRALVVLHVARPRQRVAQIVEGRIARHLKLRAHCGHWWRRDTTECAGEGLQVRACVSRCDRGGCWWWHLHTCEYFHLYDVIDRCTEVAAAALVVAAFLTEVAVAVGAAALVAAEPDVDPPTMFPWLSTAATAANLVLIPNTALKASACAPVCAVLLSKATLAVAQVACAV